MLAPPALAEKAVSLAKIVPGPNPRRYFSAEALEELTNSIRERGILQRIIVRPMPSSDDYEIVAGERRYRAAVAAWGRDHEILVNVGEYSDEQALLVSIEENEQRENPSETEQADAALRLLDMLNGDRAETARRLYENGKERDSSYATSHPVTLTDAGPVIGAGVPISKDQVKKTFSGLLPRRSLTVLPLNVLSLDQDTTIWWTQARKAPLHIDLIQRHKDGREFKALGNKGSHMIPYPALLHVAHRGTFSVFALKADARPSATTELFHAPFLNLYQDGRLCNGTARIPDPADPDVQHKCDELLFDSWSTHPNFDEAKQTLHPGGMLDLLDALLADGRPAFPTDTLAPVGITLGDYLRSISSN